MNLNNTHNLEKEYYFEMSKEQIFSSFKNILLSLKKWKKYFYNNDIKKIKEEYKQIESNIAILELCLADYDDIFHCEGISYSFYEIGNILNNVNNK